MDYDKVLEKLEAIRALAERVNKARPSAERQGDLDEIAIRLI